MIFIKYQKQFLTICPINFYCLKMEDKNKNICISWVVNVHFFKAASIKAVQQMMKLCEQHALTEEP